MQLLSMPRLGQTMDVGIVVTHHVAAGDSFTTGDLLYTVETEKVETEIEAKTDGRLLRWLAGEGDEVDVGAPVAVLGKPDDPDDPEQIDRFVAERDTGADAPPTDAATDTATTPTPSPARHRVRAMPKARALAKERGLDLAEIEPNADGPVTVADVETHLAAHASSGASRDRTAEPIRFEGHRRAMRSSMATSWSTIPHFTELIQVDASELLAERARLAGPTRAPTVTAYLIRAFARTCFDLPVLHATLVDGGMLEHDQVDMAVAVDTDHGLVAPVIRAADQLDVVAIADRLTDLAERARTRRLTIDDVDGGHVALSNLGAYGVEAGAPIIPPGHTAMLFAGAIVERAVVVDGNVVARPTMWLSLTADHRLIDGATAARALQMLRRSIEHPDSE